MAETKPKPVDGEVFLIDGNSLAYRAFFALPESIATADGRPTNAIYGFASMMAKLLIDYRPGPVIVAWDRGMSGRDTEYAEYKAGRRSRPDLLREQWPHLAPLAEAFGFTNVDVEGFEADDVIATLTRQAREAGTPVMIVSGDRDVYQLVRDGVRVMTTSRGVTDTKVYDSEGVVERYGVAPELVPDLIGLKGDTSDNIPGVPGIGDKTAAQLLQKFGSLEKVLDSVDEISGAKRKENLTEHADDARISKQLATMKLDVDVPEEVLGAEATGPDLSRLRDFAAEFELRAVIQRLEDEYEGEVPSRAVDETIEVAAAPGAPSDLADGPIALSIEGGSWSATDGERAVTGDAADLAALAGDLKGRPLVAHDAKSLGGRGRHGLLATAGAGGLEIDHDTMIGAYLVDPARRTYVLEELAADAGIAVRSGAEAPADDGQLALGEEAAPADPAATARLAWELTERQREQLAQFGLERVMREVELPLVDVLVAMENEGLGLDTQRLAAIGEGMGERIAALEARDLRGRGSRVHDRLPAAARRGPVRRARADAQAAGQDRLLDRRPGPLADSRRAFDRPGGGAVARADQAQEHLSGHAARVHRSGDRADPHGVQPGDRRDRPPVEHQPEPPEHPDPLRRRAAGPVVLRRRRGQPADLRRLQPGRAARACPHRRARTCCARSSSRARTSTARPRRGSSAPTPTRSRPPSARRRRWSTTASPTA